MPGSYGSNRREGIQSRARAARWTVATILAILALRLVVLQVVHHDKYADLARNNILREEVLPAIRGVIRDRDGVVLVDSVPSFTVAIDPFDRAYLDGLANLESTLSALSTMIGEPAETMLAKIEAEKKRSYRPVPLKAHVPPETVAYIEERRDRLPGVVVEVVPMRRYVHGGAAAHVLGYVGEVSGAEIGQSNGVRTYRTGDLIGRSGLERRYEPELGGQNGRRLIEVNALGRRADRLLGEPPNVEAPQHGEDMVLTLDYDVQRAAAAAFPDSMSGAVVVMDVRDGGILAILSRPTFDPNEFARGLTRDQWQALNSDPAHPLHDRALMASYPPGSVFKVITGLAALQAHQVGLMEILDIPCNAGMQFGNRWFGCHHSHGSTSFETALTISCDVYFYQLGLRLGLDRLSAFARSAGLGRPTGFELKEASGLVPDREWYDRRFGPRGWTRGNILNLAIGQGEVLATPLQLATLMASIAREWRPVVPYIVQRVGDEDRRPVPPPQSVVVDPLLHRALVRAMHSVVQGARGTGQRARVHGIAVAGKTGTAQNPHGEDHAVFAGFAPVEAPRIAFAVVVEHGGHGGAAAAPVAAEVIDACFGQGGAAWAEAGTEAAVPGGD